MPNHLDDTLRRRDESWRALRRRRASGAAAVAEARQATFRAALEQAEQQFRAAALIGYDSRALNLFYGLSQGGRALAAIAPTLGDDAWKLVGHGLGSHKEVPADVTAVVVTPDRRAGASFTTLSMLLGSPCEKEAVTLGQLWPLMYETTAREPLGERIYVPGTRNPRSSPVAGGMNFDVVIDSVSVFVPQGIWDTPADKRPSVAEFIARYPAYAGAILGHDGVPFQLDDLEGWEPVRAGLGITWPLPRRIKDQPHPVMAARLRRYRGLNLVVPSVGGHDTALHPLMVWWQVLYALSMLTRYHPDRWTEMIDVNVSQQAVAIDDVLDLALDAVPDLLDEAFDLIDPPARPAAG